MISIRSFIGRLGSFPLPPFCRQLSFSLASFRYFLFPTVNYSIVALFLSLRGGGECSVFVCRNGSSSSDADNDPSGNSCSSTSPPNGTFIRTFPASMFFADNDISHVGIFSYFAFLRLSRLPKCPFFDDISRSFVLIFTRFSRVASVFSPSSMPSSLVRGVAGYGPGGNPDILDGRASEASPFTLGWLPDLSSFLSGSLPLSSTVLAAGLLGETRDLREALPPVSISFQGSRSAPDRWLLAELEGVSFSAAPFELGASRGWDVVWVSPSPTAPPITACISYSSDDVIICVCALSVLRIGESLSTSVLPVHIADRLIRHPRHYIQYLHP